MAFKDLIEYAIEDILSLITNSVEESIHLDFKASGALSNQDNKRKEIAKDVSSFANSDGGVIVYGITEVDHKASALSYIDGDLYNKEWLENVISSNIQKRIDGIEIIPIRDGNEISKTIYIVKIPRSNNAPHMSSDNRYYKRFNFKSVPMEEYEVRDLFHRVNMPKLRIAGKIVTRNFVENGMVEYTFRSAIFNDSEIICSQYKLNWYIVGDKDKIGYSFDRLYDKINYTTMADNEVKFSISEKQAIYPKEAIDMPTFKVAVKELHYQYIERITMIKMKLFYQGGIDEIEVSLKSILGQ